MAKVPLAEQRTRPSSQERHQVQSMLGNSTVALDGFPLIQPVGQEANQTHHGYDDTVSDCGNNHDLLFAFRSVSTHHVGSGAETPAKPAKSLYDPSSQDMPNIPPWYCRCDCFALFS
jgi:hypothetical protein